MVAKRLARYCEIELVLAGVLLLRLCINGALLFGDLPAVASMYSAIPVVVAGFVFYLAYVNNAVLPRRAIWVLCFVGACMILSLCALSKFGEMKLTYFNFALYFVVASLLSLRCEQWEKVFQAVSLALLGLIAINLIAQHEAVFYYFEHPEQGHPIVSSFFEGGVNIEASWMGAFGVFFSRNKKGAFYLTSCTALAALYGSRSGLIACLLAIAYVLLVKGAKNVKRNVLLAMGAMLAMVALFVAAANALGLAVSERLFSIGSEPGSLGRLRMWMHAGDALFDIPLFGVGAGNAVAELALVSGDVFPEDNAHNVYLQILLDFGPLAFCVFVAIVASFVVISIRGGFQNPFSACLVIYFVLAFLQFSGPEPLLALVAGAFVATSRPMSPIARRASGRDALRPFGSRNDGVSTRIASETRRMHRGIEEEETK